MFDLGIILSLATVFFWVLLDVCMNYSVSNMDANPVVFACAIHMSGGFALLMLAGPGRLVWETFKTWHTWMHGLLQVFVTMFYSLALVYITATEVNFIMRIDMVMTMIMTALFLNRKPSKHDLIGTAFVALSVYLFTMGIDPAIRIIAFTMVALSGFFHTLRTIEAEHHPTSIKAQHNFRDRARVSGIILICMGTLTMLVYLGLAQISAAFSGTGVEVPALFTAMPSISEILTTDTIKPGFIIGALIFGPSTYFYLYLGFRSP